MKRLLLHLEYNGQAYHGWQRNSEVITVQGQLEGALQALTGEALQTYGAGRTDTGVHALGQFAHFDVNTARLASWPLIKFWDGLNHYLRPQINVLGVAEVPADFHARFSAQSRRYRYLIMNRRTGHPHWYERAAFIGQPLDITAMQKACAAFPVGEADWSAFQSAECTSTTSMVNMRQMALAEASFFPDVPGFLFFDIEADHFLHHMVRTIVGTLIEVGQGKRQPESIPALFASGQRVDAGYTAPGYGLYLTHVRYPAIKVGEKIGDIFI